MAWSDSVDEVTSSGGNGRQNVGPAPAGPGGAPACVDCWAASAVRPGSGRPARCAQHRKQYRAWYQRKWRYESRHGEGSYGDAFTPAWIHPATAAATVAASEVAALEKIAEQYERGVMMLLAQVGKKVSAQDRPYFESKVREFAATSIELRSVIGRLKGR